MGGSVPDLSQVGLKAEPQLAQSFRREVAEYLGRDSIHFPGAQPVSFARKHMRELRSRDYYLCEKSDGIRCLLYFTADAGQEIHYLIDRKNDYYFVAGLHFPLPAAAEGQPIDWGSFHKETILDGELLFDEYPGGRKVLKYLVFDCLVYHGSLLISRPLDKRIAYFMDFIHKPYAALCQEFPDDAADFPFILEKKAFQVAYGTEMMFKDILPSLRHGSDGLIFTCRETPYTFGTDEKILKWKPAEENTIDFKLELDFPRSDGATDHANHFGEDIDYDYDAMPTFILHVNVSGSGVRRFGTLLVMPEEWVTMKQWAIEHDDGLDGQIVECHRDPQGEWRFNRFRTDKSDPNHHTVVQKVLESIEDAVSQDDLVSAAGDIRTAWKKRVAFEEQQRKEQRKRQEDHQKTRDRRESNSGAAVPSNSVGREDRANF